MSNTKSNSSFDTEVSNESQVSTNNWKMRVIKVYDDEKEEIITYVSTYDTQGQSIKAN